MSAYQIMGGAIGLSHTKAESISVYGKLSGKTYLSNRDNWSRLDEKEKKCYLAEEHEIAHHVLLTSTIAGLLLWRMNQVWQRDVTWQLSELARLDIAIPNDKNLLEWFTDSGSSLLLSALLERFEKERANAMYGYFLEVFENIENTLFCQEVLFGYTNKPKPLITRGDFCERFNRWNTWASKRCELAVGTPDYDDTEGYDEEDHTCPLTTREPEEHLFPDGAQFNISDLVEAHATCKELWILEQHGDAGGAAELMEIRKKQPLGRALEFLANNAKSANWEIGFSPSIAMKAITMSLQARMDVTAIKNMRGLELEDVLPWLRMASKPDLLSISSDDLADTALGVVQVLSHPKVGARSLWVKFPLMPEGLSLSEALLQMGNEGLSALSGGLASHEVNSALYVFTKNISAALKSMFGETASFSEAARSVSEWEYSARMNLIAIEYKDGVWLSAEPILGSIKPFDERLGIFREPDMVLLGIVLGSCNYYLARASWTGSLQPHPEIVMDKIGCEIGSNLWSGCSAITSMLIERMNREIYKNALLDKQAAVYLKR